MQAGALRHRITLQAAVDTQDGTTGEPVRSWSTIATVWASVLPMKGREIMAVADTPLAECDTRILIRWAPALANLGPKSRAVHLLADGRIDVYYNIVSVTEVQMKRQVLELMCKSGTNEG